jgi:uncharacterized membrane protein
MNIHPAFVHFPIALLIVYAILECIRPRYVMERRSWHDIKAAFVLLGTLSAFAALTTGEMAEEIVERTQHQLVEMHSLFATISTWIFGLLALAYLIALVTEHVPALAAQVWWEIIKSIGLFIERSYIAIPFALLGIVTLTIAGALGGAIVYGPDADPIVSFIYSLFFSR